MKPYTKTERALLAVLGEGRWRKRATLMEVMMQGADSPPESLHVTLCRLRAKLRPLGRDLISKGRKLELEYAIVTLTPSDD